MVNMLLQLQGAMEHSVDQAGDRHSVMAWDCRMQLHLLLPPRWCFSWVRQAQGKVRL